MAFATLTKGPVGFILPLLVSLVYLSVQKDWKAMRRMKLLTGMALLIVMVLSWYLPAVLKGGQDLPQRNAASSNHRSLRKRDEPCPADLLLFYQFSR